MSDILPDKKIIIEGRMNRLYPYFLVVVALFGISLVIYLHNFNISIFSLIIILPVILVAVTIFYNNKSYVQVQKAIQTRLQFNHLLLLNAFIYAISLVSLISGETRTLLYFIFIALFSGGVFLQILSSRHPWMDKIIVLEIVLLSLNLIWGTGLKYPLYFSDTDTLGHLNLINTILQTGHIDKSELFYRHYPLYHLFIAIGNEITGLSLRITLFVIMGLIWQVGIMFSYLIFKRITKDPHTALVACLLFATSSQLIFYGSYAIARSLAFVFFVSWLYVIIGKARYDYRYVLLSILILSAMVMTHHLNVLFTIPVLIIFLLCQIPFYRRYKINIIRPTFVYLLALFSISYLVLVASDMTKSTLPLLFKEMSNKEVIISGDITRGYGASVAFGIIYYAFVLLLCLLGFKMFTDINESNGKKKIAGPFVLSGLLLLVVYIPGPLDLLRISDIVLTYRFPLIVSPLVAILMAYGIKFIIHSRIYLKIKTYVIYIAAGLITVTTFFSIISVGNANDTDFLPNTANMNSSYFTFSEMASFLLLNDKADNTIPVYADYQTIRNYYALPNLADKKIITNGDINYIDRGYLILRISEMERKKSLTFSVNGRVDTAYFYRYYPDIVTPDQNIQLNLEYKNKIIDDLDVQIYLIHSEKSLVEILR